MPTDRKLPPQPVLLIILAGLGMVGPFSIDTVFPAFGRMEAEFGVGEVAVQQIIAVYMAAFAIMSLFHGPLSDALGRKPVIIAGGVVFVAASIFCALAPTLPLLLLGRFLQGASAGAGAIISRAMVPDMFEGHLAQRVMSHIAMIFGLAPALAPIVGGWLLKIGDWRLMFWFLAGFGLLLVLLCVFVLPETHPAADRTPLRLGALARNLWGVARTPAGVRLTLATTFNFAGMFSYIASASLFVVGLLGLGERDFWVLFVPLIGGMVLGSWVAGRLAGRVDGRRLATVGYLISLVAGVANIVLSMIPATQHLPFSVAALPVFSFGVAIAFPILTVAMLESFPHSRGAASSFMSFVQLAFNALLAGAIAPLIATSLPSLAIATFVSTCLGFGFWLWHLVASAGPATAPASPQAYEPLDDM